MKQKAKDLKEFAEQIKTATTKEQLRAISYEAFKQDDELGCVFKKNSLSNKVNALCVKREIALGL